MKKSIIATLVVAAAMVLVFCTPASAQVQFRSVMDHFDTVAQARQVPVAERKYYKPYFNLHDVSQEKLGKGERLVQLKMDYLFREVVPERLGGRQIVFGKEGDWYVQNDSTGEIVRDPRCGNLIDWAEPAPALPGTPPATATAQPVVVNLPAPQVVVNVPEQQPAQVVVNVPQQPAPQVVVNMPPRTWCEENPTWCFTGKALIAVGLAAGAIWGLHSLGVLGGQTVTQVVAPAASTGVGPGAIIGPAF